MRAHYHRPRPWKEWDSAEIDGIIKEAEEAAAATAAAPCPFCGGEPEVKIRWIYHFSADIVIRCAACKCGTARLPVGTMITGRVYTVADRVDQAAAIWNKRANENPN